MLAAQAVASAATAEIVVAGGQENMSAAPHVLPNSRNGQRMGDWKLVDTMIVDGLWDVYDQYRMGIDGRERGQEVRHRHAPTQDQRWRSAAQTEGRGRAGRRASFNDEIRAGQHRRRRRATRSSSPPTSSSTARPAPKRSRACAPPSTRPAAVTAGNASGLNDGAAAVMVMTAKKAAALGLKPLGRIASYATAGLDPAIMGMGPVPASTKALQRAGWKAADLDLLEINEAFAAQACAVNKEMGWDVNKVNVNGGAIAIGHPIGASGCRILVTLLHEMQRQNAKKGIASLCIGGGMGVALTIER